MLIRPMHKHLNSNMCRHENPINKCESWDLDLWPQGHIIVFHMIITWMSCDNCNSDLENLFNCIHVHINALYSFIYTFCTYKLSLVVYF
jgi:hypothetical protein